MKRVLFLLASVVVWSSSIYAQSGNAGIGAGTSGSKLTVNGSFAAQFRNETNTSAPIGANDHYIAYHGTANGALTLPAAISGTGNFKGRQYFIKNSSTSTLTIAASGGELIDNQTDSATVTINAGYAMLLVSTGTTSGVTWEVVLVVQPEAAGDATRYIGGTIGAKYNQASGSVSTSANPQAVPPLGGIDITMGNGYTVSNPSNGVFVVTFNVPFTKISGLSTNIMDTYGNSGGSATNPNFSVAGTTLWTNDNSQVTFISNNSIKLRTGNSAGNLSNRSITFLVTGR